MEVTLTPRQLYYKQYYKDHRDHIMEVVLKYQSEHKEEKKAYYTRYNREYFQKHKQQRQMKPAAIKIPRPEKVKILPLDLITMNGAIKEPKEKKTQKKIAAIATIDIGVLNDPKFIAKSKHHFEIMSGSFVLNFD